MDLFAFSFGPFRLDTAQRTLFEGEKPVRLGSRAFDILAVLLERAGEIVGKEDLIARAWPQISVEEANLKIQVSALRRALGDGQAGHRYIVTVPGRGYNFVAPVTIEDLSRTKRPPAITPTGAHNLPVAAVRMIGREDAVATLVSRISRERLLVIVGPGGIGKTTVALAVMERAIPEYEHGVWMIDLAPIRDARLVPSAVATVLDLEISTQDPLPGLASSLRDKRMLLMLDNCEHVIDAAAGLIGAILGGAPDVKILATSRESLGVAGERDFRLGPLNSPPLSPEITAAEATTYPAVQLFVERVTAIVEDFILTDENARPVVEICQRLDGLPLAIEFAAPRVEVLGVEGLAAHLDDSLPLLGGRRRTSTPRHRTMRTVLDWSFSLLSESEQNFFQALGIFHGGFTVEAATAVNAGRTPIDVMDRLADLVAKSLVVADVAGAKPRFRLLDTTRAYASDKLHESGEQEAISRRHAAYYCNLFERAEAEAAIHSWGEWLGDYAREIDNLRAALSWAFSPGGDGSIALALTAAAVPLWMRLSLLEECRSRVKQALGILGAERDHDLRDEMRLHAALGGSTSEAAEMGTAYGKALELAEELGDSEYRLRALRGLYFYHGGSGRYRAALPFAERFHALAMGGPDPSDRLFGERMMGVAKHCLGDQIGARRHLEQVLPHFASTQREPDIGRAAHIVRFHTDLRISTRVYLARVLWLQGFPHQAVQTAKMSLEEAQASGHALSLCYALTLAACPIALWVGNLTAAATYAEMLLEQSRKHNLRLWNVLGARYKRVVAIRACNPDQGSQFDHMGIDEIVEPNLSFRYLAGLTELAEALANAGRMAEGLAVVEAGIEQSEMGWLTPELLRLKGELFLLQNDPAHAEAAGSLFRQALDSAHRQEMLSWELRAATSLARLLREHGRFRHATAALQPVYDRFTEGFDTTDLVAARQLLDMAPGYN